MPRSVSRASNATTVWFSSIFGRFVTRSCTSRPARSSSTASRATFSCWARVTKNPVRRVVQLRERGVEARELAELPEPTRQHEAVVRVEVVDARVARADQVRERESVAGKSEIGCPRARARRAVEVGSQERPGGARGEQDRDTDEEQSPRVHRANQCSSLNGTAPIVKNRVLSSAGSLMSRVIAALYGALYDGVLCRLPEPIAIALGQTVLRLVPLDRLPVFRLADPRLATTLGGVRLPNPLILAAMYYDPRILSRAMGLGFGAVTTKSITVGPRPGHPQPSLVRIRTAAGPGLVNCNGFQNPGLGAFRASLATLRHRVPLIVSVAGESVDEYVTLVSELAPFGDLVERSE